MLEFLNTWWWAFLTVAAVISFIANYTQIVDWWKKRDADKQAQPELAITIDNFRRNRIIPPDSKGYISSDLDGKQLDSADRERIANDYYFEWHYDIIIRNQTEHVALRFEMPSINEGLLGLTIDPSPDYTQPMIRGNDYRYRIIFRKKHRCTSDEADDFLRTYPVNKIRIEYTNTVKVKFATEFYFTEHQAAKQNVYLKIG